MSRLRRLASAVLVALMPGWPMAAPAWVPAPLDENLDLIERYWSWLLAETGAPPGLPHPRIDVLPLPSSARMVLQFPTEAAPHRELRIIASVRSIERAAAGEELIVIGELGHELVHFVLLLKENDWDPSRRPMENRIHHHCDPTFMRLARHVGTIIWDSYHSNDAVRSIDHMVRLSCWRDGHRIGLEAQR